MGDCLRVQVRNGEWFANDGKTKRKSSQYFEVTHSPDLLLFIAVHSANGKEICANLSVPSLKAVCLGLASCSGFAPLLVH